MPHIVVLVHRIGPYHFARLRAAGCSMQVTALELCGKDSTYDWNQVGGADGFRRLTLFAAENEVHDSPQEVWKRLSHGLDFRCAQVVAVPGLGRDCFLDGPDWWSARAGRSRRWP